MPKLKIELWGFHKMLKNMVYRNNKTEIVSSVLQNVFKLFGFEVLLVCGMNWQVSRLLVLFLIVGSDRGMAFKNM